MTRFSPRRSATLLGLVWHENRLYTATASRSRKQGASVTGTANIPWAAADLAPETTGPVATRLKQALSEAGVRPAPSLMALPPEWILTATVPLPELAAGDLDSFVHLTAERSFPVPPDELQIARSVVRTPEQSFLTLLAVRREVIDRVVALLTAAGVKPAALTLTLPAPLAGNEGRLLLTLDTSGTLLAVQVDGGTALLRSLDPVSDDAVSLARELRVTWEQLAPALRRALRDTHLVGESPALETATPVLKRWAATAGLSVDFISAAAGDRATAAVASMAVAWLDQPGTLPSFLPPQPSRWSRILSRGSSRRMARIGLAAGALVLLAAGALVWRAATLWTLRSRWADMKPAVEAQEKVQGDVRFFRSWTDTAPRNLTLLKVLSEAFPTAGTVNAKTIEIRGLSSVSVSGTTTDNAALLKTMDKLRQQTSVADLKLEQIHGRAPAQFTFKFTWKDALGK